MVRALNRLTDAFCRTAAKPGRHADGGELYLNVDRRHGGKSWVFMWTRYGKRREAGLGRYPGTSLARARRKAIDYRAAVDDGRDPIAEHRREILRPLWTTRHVTATRLRNRIENVLDYAHAHGWTQGENPARWRGHLNKLLAKAPRTPREHHRALPYDEASAFMDRLRAVETMPSWAVQLIFLTASRRGEALGMTWDEVDFDEGLWTIPAGRTKPGAVHQVPLSRQALALLARMRKTRHSRYVFTGLSPDKPLSPSAVDVLLRRLDFAYTLHGSSRSAFRDWAGDLTTHPREVAEAALGHAVGNAVERSYRRGSALEKRRRLMQDWADYLGHAGGDNVIKLHGR